MAVNDNFPAPDVLIVGAGPVGMTLACVLARQNISVRIIDRNDGPTAYSKAIGIHARTLELMHTIGIAEAMVERGNPMQRFRVNADRRCIIDASFASISSRYPFVLGLPQSVTEHLLSRQLAECGVSVERNTEIVEITDAGSPADPGRPARVILRGPGGNGESVSTSWLCGCDGSRSSVRTLLDIDFPGGDYRRAFILGDVRIDSDEAQDELQFFISRHGYLLMIPMPRGMHRIIAQTDKTLDDFQGTARPEASLEELQAIVDRNGPGGVRVHSPAWLTCAPFYYRLAETPRRGRAFLLGDALHLYSPLGAQGLNTGAHDAFNLGWKLAQVISGSANLALLDSYTEERMAIARKIAEVTSRTTRFITNTTPWYRTLRKSVVPLVNASRRVQIDLPWLMSGLRQSYAGHSLSAGNPAGDLKPGDRCPHAYVRVDGALRPLAAMVHGQHFTLLVLHRRDTTDHRQNLMKWLDNCPAAKRLRTCYITREPMEQNIALGIDTAHAIEDTTAEVFHAFGLNQGFVLVRPDGHLALLDSNAGNLGAVADYFAGPYWTFDEPVKSEPSAVANAYA
ncbi:MAG: FAD-dependent monooxygenase [Aquisalimonadaceae bacterium]